MCCAAPGVKPDNLKGLMTLPDVDGALVGCASLKADSFLKLVFYGQAVVTRGAHRARDVARPQVVDDLLCRLLRDGSAGGGR
jgi:hypothetical protein